MSTENEITIIDPALPIIDTHHHLFDRLPDFLAAILGFRRFLVDEYMDQVLTGHNVVASVFIEAMAMYRKNGPKEFKVVGETEFANGQAAMAASGVYGPCQMAAGIVSHADLTLGDRIRPVLEAHIEAAPKRFRGIRLEGMWDADPAVLRGIFNIPEKLYASPEFRAGFAHLASLGLSFDAFVLAPQLADVIDLASDFPDTSIILDHLGNPVNTGRYAGKLDEHFPQWKRDMTLLAQHRNVTVKMGGLGTFIMGFPLDKPLTDYELAEKWKPYAMTALELFGADRCMFESNTPTDQAGSFRSVCNAYKIITQGCSLDEKRAIFAGTANRVYRLGLDEVIA
jgi:L-fuconolactonase